MDIEISRKGRSYVTSRAASGPSAAVGSGSGQDPSPTQARRPFRAAWLPPNGCSRPGPDMSTAFAKRGAAKDATLHPGVEVARQGRSIRHAAEPDREIISASLSSGAGSPGAVKAAPTKASALALTATVILGFDNQRARNLAIGQGLAGAADHAAQIVKTVLTKGAFITGDETGRACEAHMIRQAKAGGDMLFDAVGLHVTL